MMPHKPTNGFPRLAPSVGVKATKRVKCYTEESALCYCTAGMYPHKVKAWLCNVYTQGKGVAMFGLCSVLKVSNDNLLQTDLLGISEESKKGQYET